MATVRWLDVEQQRIWRQVVGTYARLLAHLDAELHDRHGLRLSDYEVLIRLSETPERRLRMSELAQQLNLSPSGLTRRVDSLVRQGLVSRRACPSDGRGSFAVLTDAGLSKVGDAAITHVEGVRRYVIDPLPDGQLAALGAAFRVIDQALDAQEPPAADRTCADIAQELTDAKTGA